jgi:hypothetical protein
MQQPWLHANDDDKTATFSLGRLDTLAQPCTTEQQDRRVLLIH